MKYNKPLWKVSIFILSLISVAVESKANYQIASPNQGSTTIPEIINFKIPANTNIPVSIAVTNNNGKAPADGVAIPDEPSTFLISEVDLTKELDFTLTIEAWCEYQVKLTPPQFGNEYGLKVTTTRLSFGNNVKCVWQPRDYIHENIPPGSLYFNVEPAQ